MQAQPSSRSWNVPFALVLNEMVSNATGTARPTVHGAINDYVG
jgi:hypothetical protein